MRVSVSLYATLGVFLYYEAVIGLGMLIAAVLCPLLTLNECHFRGPVRFWSEERTFVFLSNSPELSSAKASVLKFWLLITVQITQTDCIYQIAQSATNLCYVPRSSSRELLINILAASDSV